MHGVQSRPAIGREHLELPGVEGVSAWYSFTPRAAALRALLALLASVVCLRLMHGDSLMQNIAGNTPHGCSYPARAPPRPRPRLFGASGLQEVHLDTSNR